MIELLERAVISAVISVGITQIVKLWLPVNIKSKWYSLIFAVVTFAFSVAYEYMPESVVNAFMALSVGNLGYDNIIKVIQKALQTVIDKASGGSNGESENV